MAKNVDVILCSSGPRAPAYLGAVKAIYEKGYNIERLAGISGGAVIAAGLALGFSVDKMEDLSYRIDYRNIRDFSLKNLLNIRNASLYAGEQLNNLYKHMFGDAKLSDFKIDCRIFATDLKRQEAFIISPDNYPDLEVWKAVRISSSIPLMFPYIEFDGHCLGDGNIVFSKIEDVFPQKDNKVIAIKVRADRGLLKPQVPKTPWIWNYLKIVSRYLLNHADHQHIPVSEWDRTIMIYTHEISGFDFEISEKQVKKLIDYGYHTTMASPVLPFVGRFVEEI